MNATDKPTTYTVRANTLELPEGLMVVPTGLPMPANYSGWYVRHNQAVTDWRKARVGAVSASTPNERAVLELCEGLYRWTMAHDGLEDGYAMPNVVAPMIEAIRHALNFECGRLDCGTVDSWLCDIAGDAGWDLDANAWAEVAR